MKKFKIKDQLVRKTRLQSLKLLKSGTKLKKIKSLMVNWDPIEQIKNQGPYCKRHSNLGLLIEFDRGEIT